MHQQPCRIQCGQWSKSFAAPFAMTTGCTFESSSKTLVCSLVRGIFLLALPAPHAFSLGRLPRMCLLDYACRASRTNSLAGVLGNLARKCPLLVSSAARNSARVLASLCGLGRIVFVLGGLFATVYRPFQNAVPSLPDFVADCGFCGLGWMRTRSSLLRHGIRRLHACP